MPANLKAADFSFQNCNNPTAAVTFAGLPGQAGVHRTTAVEGMEFDITDSTTTTWGANVTIGGGGNHVKVRYNGTNWTVVGK